MTAPGPAGWSRLHPLTPLLRGGRFLLVVLAAVTQQGLRSPSLSVLGAAAAVVTTGALLFGYLSWRTTRYRLADGELQVDSGVLQRRTRRVPLARLQSVDVVRPLLARVLGLAELRLEVAGGGDSEAPLAYLAEDEAHALRVQLLALSGAQAGRVAAQGGQPAPPVAGQAAVVAPGAAPGEPEESVLVQVPLRALVVSVLLGGPALLTAALLLAAIPVLLLAPEAVPGLLAGLGPVGLGSAGFVVRRLLAEYGFTVAESPDGLRLRHGLLETRAQTIPAGRVQTVRVHEPLLWRRRGWVRVEVDVAGYEHDRHEPQAGTSALLPVAPREFALALVDRVLGAPLPPATVPPPPAARWRALLSYRRLRLGLDDRHLVTTSGVLTTTTDAVPLAKVQSLRLVQGPWQRRLRLASVHADSAGRRLPGAVARHRDAAEAAALLAELTLLARQARRR